MLFQVLGEVEKKNEKTKSRSVQRLILCQKFGESCRRRGKIVGIKLAADLSLHRSLTVNKYL